MTHANLQTTAPWSYQAPSTPSELLTAVAVAGHEAVLLAGGQSLLPALGRRAMQGGCLIDVSRIAELRQITILPDRVEIGAASTFNEILLSNVSTIFPALTRALRCVGTHTIRNRATVGGSLAWADPRAELPLVLLTHDAMVLTSQREIAIDRFIRGPFQCALEPGEVILGVRIARNDGVRHGFAELLDRNSAGKAIVSVSLALYVSREQNSLRFAVGAVADRPVVSPSMRFGSHTAAAEHEQAMRRWLEQVCSDRPPLVDPFHSIQYRCEMALVLARRIERELQL